MGAHPNVAEIARSHPHSGLATLEPALSGVEGVGILTFDRRTGLDKMTPFSICLTYAIEARQNKP